MTVTATRLLPHLRHLPASLPGDGSINIALEEGVPVFRASPRAQARTAALVDAQSRGRLSADEAVEIDAYEEIDAYLSHLNRLVRNLVRGAGV
ncbi:hypothetical protein DCC79_11255 [bacterium]|nr:MAG: hypothetical protein DCC79_11255 [bacterium]